MLTLALAWILAQDAPEELVRKLGAEDYAEREKAAEALKKLGAGAEAALRKGAESEDPEVRARSKALLEGLKPAPSAPPRRPARPPFAPGFRGSSVSVRTVNGDSTYVITPGDGSAALSFHKAASGAVKLDYADDEGRSRSVEAASLAAFLKEHKDLAAKFGLSEEGIDYAGARVSFRGLNPFGVPGKPFRFNFGRKGWPFAEEEEERKPVPSAPKASGFESVSDALRAQLGLPEGQGVLVSRDDAAPGLRRHDVLLELDGKPIATPAEARKASEAATLTILRKGKRETIQVPPRKDF